MRANSSREVIPIWILNAMMGVLGIEVECWVCVEGAGDDSVKEDVVGR